MHYQSVRIELAIVKFDNCATADQIVSELQNQAETSIRRSAILSVLTELVGKGFVMRVVDQPETHTGPETDTGQVEEFYILSESGYEHAKSAIWMIDNMHPSELTYLID